MHLFNTFQLVFSFVALSQSISTTSACLNKAIPPNTTDTWAKIIELLKAPHQWGGSFTHEQQDPHYSKLLFISPSAFTQMLRALTKLHRNL